MYFDTFNISNITNALLVYNRSFMFSGYCHAKNIVFREINGTRANGAIPDLYSQSIDVIPISFD